MNQQNIIIPTLIVILVLILVLFYLHFQNQKESFEGIAGTSFVSRVPKGTIVAYYPPDGKITSIPAGWVACDGKTDFISGKKVPDLRGRFIRMYSDDLTGQSDQGSYVTRDIGTNVPDKHLNGYGRSQGQHISYIQKLQFGDVGGTDLQKMNEWEMPTHNHDHNIFRSGDDDCGASNTFDCGEGGGKSGVVIGNAGQGMPHNNTPPYYVLVYIIKL